MPRKNNRDRRYEPKENGNLGSNFSAPTENKKPVRRRKGKNDKKIYRSEDE